MELCGGAGSENIDQGQELRLRLEAWDSEGSSVGEWIKEIDILWICIRKARWTFSNFGITAAYAHTMLVSSASTDSTSAVSASGNDPSTSDSQRYESLLNFAP